jgi:cytochrome o ubiquinol oxidase subunit 1
MVTFVIGGMTGVMLAVPPADFVLHNSLFLIAHFHNVIIGGVVFGLMAGIVYWFPKAFGYKLDPFWGKMSFWFWQIGFYFAFMPLYVLGLMGVTRRVSQFEDPSLQIWFIIAAFGAILIALGIASFLIQLVVSYLRRDQLRDCDRRSPGMPARSNGRPRRRRRITISPSRRSCTTMTAGTT